MQRSGSIVLQNKFLDQHLATLGKRYTCLVDDLLTGLGAHTVKKVRDPNHIKAGTNGILEHVSCEKADPITQAKTSDGGLGKGPGGGEIEHHSLQ